MKVKYDPSVDAAYISFQDNVVQVTTVRLTEDIAIDFGPDEKVYGIEVLDASRHLGFKAKEPSITIDILSRSSSTRAGPQSKLLEAIRMRYPKAYEKWTEQEELLLAQSFKEGHSISELALLLQRQPGAIEARLHKLGLVQR